MTLIGTLRLGACAAGLGLLLAGCGGGGDGGGDAPLTLSQQSDAMVDRLNREARFNTGYTGQPGEMPSTGTARFAGFAGIDVRGARPVDLTGRATLTADFANRTITGRAAGFEGERNGTLSRYAGTIRFVDGAIGRDPAVPGSVPNDIRFRYEGTLTGKGREIVVGSDATGKFRGTPIKGLLAGSASRAAGVAEVNGVTTRAPFSLVAVKR